MTDAPRQARPAGRREAILSAATELLARHGVGNVSTRQIAREVGISQPSLYAHFPSLHALHEAVGARAFANLETRLSTGPKGSPEAALEHAMRTFITFGLTQPDAYRIAFIREMPEGARTERGAFHDLDHPGPRAFAHLEGIVGRLRPDLAPTERDVRIQCLWAAVHGLVSLLLQRPHFPWADRDRLVDEHVRLIGLLAQA